MKTLIIGAGPAGLNAAIYASCNGNQVIVIEKNEKAGKKLFITGKGRCNVTNFCDNQSFIKNIVNNGSFLYSSIASFSSSDTMDFLKDHGVDLVVERGNRVFPSSGHSFDVTDALVNECKNKGVKFHFSENVISISKCEKSYSIQTNKGLYNADFVVIATGGLSYPSTGSTGDGYRFASDLKHSIIKPIPALTGIKIKETIPLKLREYTLKNVSLIAETDSKKISEFGEMVFYQDYIDGPIVIKMSSLINRLNTVNLYIDLKPALTTEVLLARIAREISTDENMSVFNLLTRLLPTPFLDFFNNKAQFDLKEKVCNFSNVKREKLVKYLKMFPLSFSSILGFERAIVTSGGVNVKEISPRTMESVINSNLYFAGEVIDVDANTGGFNIQIALSTGYLAGVSINKKINEMLI